MEERTLKRLPGESATFKVKISGTPNPEVQWNVKGVVILPSNRIIPNIDNEFATLTLKNIMPEDECEYIIRIHNEHGEVEETVSLVVISKIIVLTIWSSSLLV